MRTPNQEKVVGHLNVNRVESRNIAAESIAAICRAVQGIGGAGIGIVACGWAISIAALVCFNHIIAANRCAIAVVIIIATTWAASIAISTSRDIRENTGCIAIS